MAKNKNTPTGGGKGVSNKSRGKRHTDKEIQAIYVCYKEYNSYRHVSKTFGIHHNTAKNIVARVEQRLQDEYNDTDIKGQNWLFKNKLTKALIKRDGDLDEMLDLLGEGLKKKAKNPTMFDSLESFGKVFGIIADKKLQLSKQQIEFEMLDIKKRELELKERELEFRMNANVVGDGGVGNNMVTIINDLGDGKDYVPDNVKGLSPIFTDAEVVSKDE